MKDVHCEVVQKSGLKGMRSVTSGLSTGGSLALAYKVLNWVDKQPLAPSLPPLDWCEAVASRSGLDWFSVVVGIVIGLVIYAFVDLVVAVKGAVLNWSEAFKKQNNNESIRKPLYRLC